MTVYNILEFIIAVIAYLLVRGARRPAAFRVERSVIVKAAPVKIFGFVNDLRGWRKWSPWENLDPNLKRTYSGPASGESAVYEWAGNSKAGQGRMEILQSIPDSLIRIKVDFLKPMEGHNTAEFRLESGGDFTTVTWAMFGKSSYLMRVMGAFFSMDKFLGKAFETGLANLKALGEA